MLFFGIGAFLLRILNYPLAPAVLAIVLVRCAHGLGCQWESHDRLAMMDLLEIRNGPAGEYGESLQCLAFTGPAFPDTGK